jgi:hypothetical protein
LPGGSSAEAGIEPSVGSVGDSYDNALAETINGLFKAEVIHRRSSWRRIEDVELATLHWVSWFNHRRLLEPIGNIPPAEAEDAYYAALEATQTIWSPEFPGRFKHPLVCWWTDDEFLDPVCKSIHRERLRHDVHA